MSFTRANILDYCVQVLGDDSTEFRTYLTAALNKQLYVLWDMHDWTFKHKSGSFNTVNGTESYNLTSTSTNIRSADDVEVMYDSTSGRDLVKVDLQDIKRAYPKEDNSGQPLRYASWGGTTIYLDPKPTAVYTIKYLYTSIPTETSADGNDLFTTCGLPTYAQPLFEKMVLSEGMMLLDESRRPALLTEIMQVWLPKAIQADMRHLESNARFRFWEERLGSNRSYGNYNDFTNYLFSNRYRY